MPLLLKITQSLLFPLCILEFKFCGPGFFSISPESKRMRLRLNLFILTIWLKRLTFVQFSFKYVLLMILHTSKDFSLKKWSLLHCFSTVSKFFKANLIFKLSKNIKMNNNNFYFFLDLKKYKMFIRRDKKISNTSLLMFLLSEYIFVKPVT